MAPDQNFLFLVAPVFAAAIALEIIVSKRKKIGSYSLRDSLNSIFISILFIISWHWYDPLQSAIASAASRVRVFNFGHGWYVFIICLIVDDLCYYVHHYGSHKIRWIWATHVVHHSSRHLNFLIASRISPTIITSPTILARVPLVVAGFDPAMIFGCMSISLTYQFFLHTELKLSLPRFFEYLFNTPSHHRVHHSMNLEYLDKNFGGTLIVWDRLFGSFEPEEESNTPKFGVAGATGQQGIVQVIFHEWIAMLGGVLRPPKS